MTAINATIIPDAEAFLEENRGDIMTDGVAAVYPVERFSNGEILLYDEEEEISKLATVEIQVKALGELVRLISEEKLFVGCIKNPIQLLDLGNWDAEVSDAFFQLCYHGEVIYG